MPFLERRLFRVSPGVEACIYAKSAEEAAGIFLRLRRITSDDLEVDEIVREEEIPDDFFDVPPISEAHVNQQKLSSSQVLENILLAPKLEAALCQPSDFPIVPELEPPPAQFMDVVWGLVETPSEIDWKVRSYLLLRYPKLRDALIDESNRRQ